MTVFRAVSRKKISDGVLGTRRRRRRYRDAEGVDGVGNGEEVSPPQPTRGLGSVVSSPSGFRGRAPAENGFGALYSCQKAIILNILKCTFFTRKLNN